MSNTAIRIIRRLTQLLDWKGPASYAGTSGQVVRVNAAETGVELHSLAEADVAGLVADLASLGTEIAASAPAAREINTTAPLTGGGNLSADRTLGISAATESAAGSMSAADKVKLDAATAAATVNTLALRDAAGDLSAASFAANPTAGVGAVSGAAITFGGDPGGVIFDGTPPCLWWDGENLQWAFRTVGGEMLSIAAAAFSGIGTAITSLNANNMTLGTLPDARLSSNIPKLNVANTFTQSQTMPTANGASGLNLSSGGTARANIDANGVFTLTNSGSAYTSVSNSFMSSILYAAEAHNVLWQADKRFDVVGSNFLAFTASVPFDGDYSSFSGCKISPGQVATITITMAGTKGNPGNITYTDGAVYVALYGGIYYGEFIGAASVRVRFLCGGTWSAWANGANVQNGNPFYQNLWRVSTNAMGNFWTQMQIEITASTNAGASNQWVAVTEIEYQATRADSWLKQSRFDKFGATEKLFGTLQFADSNGIVQASIDPSGTITSQKLQLGGSSAATTPGAVVKKLPVYDAGGTLLGFMPIYSSIA